MSKELPYFKFDVGAWDSGNIQMCDRSLKGLFIDICSLYWSRLGELPYALALQKLCNGNANELQELEKLEIIIEIDGFLTIEFLDEQLNEFQETSEKRRKAANKRWNNASALQMHCKSNAIKRREEKKREEKKKEDNNIKPDLIFSIEVLKDVYKKNERTVNAVVSNKKNKFRGISHLHERLDSFNDHLIESGELSKSWGEYCKHFLNWHKKSTNGNSKPTDNLVF